MFLQMVGGGLLYIAISEGMASVWRLSPQTKKVTFPYGWHR